MEEKYIRAKAPCKYYGKCGGCQLQHLTNDSQNLYKQNYINRLMSGFGKVNDLIFMEEPYEYRNKMHISFGYGPKGKLIAGMYEINSHRIIDIDQCMIQDPIGYEIVKTIKQIMKKYKMEPYDEDTGQGFLRHVLIKSGYKTGEVMVVLVVSDRMFHGSNNFVKILRKKHPQIETVILNVNDKDTSMILGDYEKTIYGKGFIVDELCGINFRISAKSFYQVNPKQAEVLYEKALEMAEFKGDERIIDAYCGIGTITLAASKYVKEAIGVELNSDAMRDAIKNKKYNDIKNVEFINDDAGSFMEYMASKNEKFDAVIMDPPRSGSDEVFLSSLLRLEPEKIIYISCNPETQKRDLDFLTKQGYLVKKIQPVDMFPQTDHVECIALLQREIM